VKLVTIGEIFAKCSKVQCPNHHHGSDFLFSLPKLSLKIMSLRSTYSYQEYMNTWHLNEHSHISNLNTLNVKSPDETLFYESRKNSSRINLAHCQCL